MSIHEEQLFFVGGYAPAGQPGLKAVGFSPAERAFREWGACSEISNPSFLLLHPNGRWLYAVSETGLGNDGVQGAVWSLLLAVEPGKVAFTVRNSQSTRGDWPCHLALDRTGRWLWSTNYGSGSVAVFPLNADGQLGELRHLLQHEGRGPNEARQEGPHAHSTIFAPDNRFALVADLGSDSLVVYSFDAASGDVARQDTMKTAPGSGPRHMVFNQAGDRLYVANELGSSVTVYAYEADSGKLEALQTLPTLPNGAPYSDVADIHLDKSGRFLYVSNRGHNSIAIFAVGADGQLTAKAIPPCGGDWPRNFALTPDGGHMLVANQHSNRLSLLPLQDGGAGLGEMMGTWPAQGAACVIFAP